MMASLLLGISTIAYQVLTARNELQITSVEDLTEVMTVTFKEAMAVALGALTKEYNRTGDMGLARLFQALIQLKG